MTGRATDAGSHGNVFVCLSVCTNIPVHKTRTCITCQLRGPTDVQHEDRVCQVVPPVICAGSDVMDVILSSCSDDDVGCICMYVYMSACKVLFIYTHEYVHICISC